MRKDREQATVLRKSGTSYAEIKQRLGVPRSTLSGWFKNQKWSNDVARKNVSKANTAGAMRLMVLNSVRGNRLRKVYEEAGQDALVDFEELKYHPLFIAGLMTYRAHGDKSSKYRVSISNMDPDTILLFKTFLERICAIGTYKVGLLLTDRMDEEKEKRFWIEKCGFDSSRFVKSMRTHGRSSTRMDDHGVCNIGLSSAYLKHKISSWMRLIVREINEEKYQAGIV